MSTKDAVGNDSLVMQNAVRANFGKNMSNESINVLFITDSLTIGGAEKQVVSLLNNIDIRDTNLSMAYLKDITRLSGQLDDARIKNGIFCCDVKNKIDAGAIRKLAQHIIDFEIKIIVCANTYPLFYAWLARLYSGRQPKIIDVLHSTELRTFKEKMQMIFYRPFYYFTDCLVYVCNNQKEYWGKKSLTAKNSLVIYNGVDVNHFCDIWSQNDKNDFRDKFKFTNDDYVIGLCAAMRPEKAHGDLLSAMSILVERGCKAKCLLIGDGPERESIETRIDENRQTECVKITGYLDDVRLAISSCDVMVLTSHQIETFSIAALEAMALSKPVIMSDIGGGSEQIEHGVNGYLFEPGDVVALADHIETLGNKERRVRMGKKGRETVVRKFSLERMVRAYEQLIENLGHGRK